MSARPLLPESSKTDAVNSRIAQLHSDVVQAVQAAVASDAVVVVGMAQNPFVRKARAALREANIEFTYLEYGSYFSQWPRRLSIKLWSGWPTFPQVFVRGTLIGGFEETQASLADGTFRKRLDEAEG